MKRNSASPEASGLIPEEIDSGGGLWGDRMRKGLAGAALTLLGISIGLVPRYAAAWYQDQTGDSELAQEVEDKVRDILSESIEVRCETPEEMPTAASAGAVLVYNLPFTDIVEIPSSRIHLREYVCKTVAGIDKGVGNSESYALITVAHELQHTKGVGNEAAAECYANQTVLANLRKLGYDETRLAAIGANLIDTQKLMLNVYTSPECREGGELDLTPDEVIKGDWFQYPPDTTVNK